MFTASFMKELELDAWQPDPEVSEILAKEVRLLLKSGDLRAIYELTPHNTERTRLIEEISQPRIKKALSDKALKIAHWEYVVSAHDTAVSFALRAAKSLNDFKDAPYADQLVPMRLYYDLDR